jgi:LysM domain
VSLTPVGPHACPFVAHADDRDSRSAQPDQAHRCYAEDRPEPRSLAHQRAYCLTREYSVCPVFLAWADRLAAHQLSQVQQPFPMAFPEEPVEQPARAGGRTLVSVGRGVADEPAPERVGLEGRPGLWDAGGRIGREDPDSRSLISADEIEEIDETGRLVGRTRRAVGPAEARADAVALPLLSQVQRDSIGERARTIGERARIFGDRARNFGGGRQGPTWEPRHASDDYPVLRPPRNLPAVPPMLVAAVALLVAAAAILVVPGLLAGEQPPASTRPGAAASASATPTPRVRQTAAPSEVAAQPARTYRVKPGDTVRTIATRFGISVRQLLRANPRVTNPDRIKVGDRLKIPARGGAQRSPAATASP